MGVVLVLFGAGMKRLRIISICFTEFYISPLNEREGTVGFRSNKREIMHGIY